MAKKTEESVARTGEAVDESIAPAAPSLESRISAIEKVVGELAEIVMRKNEESGGAVDSVSAANVPVAAPPPSKPPIDPMMMQLISSLTGNSNPQQDDPFHAIGVELTKYTMKTLMKRIGTDKRSVHI